jgi:hypothetical protein
MRPSACRQASSDRPSHTLARHEFRRGGFRLSALPVVDGRGRVLGVDPLYAELAATQFLVAAD